MGWSTGTDIFDTVAEHLLDAEADLNVTERVLEHLHEIMSEEHDWDTQDESKFWEHPLVGPILGNDQLPAIEKQRRVDFEVPDAALARKLDGVRAARFGHWPHIDLRDYFAAAVVTGLVGKQLGDSSKAFEWASDYAFRLSDAMLAERKKARKE